MGPVVPPVGTVAVISTSETTVNAALVPLNETSVVPVNVVPVIFTEEPITPVEGVKLMMFGRTVKFVALASAPDVVTTVIGPLEALFGIVAVICEYEFSVNVAVTPLNWTSVAPVNADPKI